MWNNFQKIKRLFSTENGQPVGTEIVELINNNNF